MPEPGDGAGQAIVGKPAGARGQHAVEGVHDDLVGEGGQLVSPGSGLGAAGEEALEQGRQNTGLAREEGAVGRGDRSRCRRCLDVGQRIDVEGGDDRGVEALEVQGEDMPVEPGLRGQDQPPGAAAFQGAVDADAGRHQAPPVQLADVEQIEGGHAAPGPLQGQTGQQAPAQGEPDQALGLEQVPHQARVLQAVGAEGLAVLAIGPEDRLRHGLLVLGLEGLAAAQHGLCDRVQAVIVEALQGGPDQVQGIQHLTAVDHHPAPAPHRASLVPGVVAGAAQVEGQLVSLEAALQHGQVEVDQVPAGEDIRVDFPDPRGQTAQQVRLAGVAHQAGGIVRGGGADQVDLLNPAFRSGPGADQGHGKDPGGFLVGFDVQGQDRGLGFPVRRRQGGVHIDPVHSGARPPGPGQANGATEPLIHQVVMAVVHVGLVGPDALLLQPVGQLPQRGQAGAARPRHGFAVHGFQRALFDGDASGPGCRPGALQVGLADIEEGPHPVIEQAEGLAGLQPAHRANRGVVPLLPVEDVQEEALQVRPPDEA